ncbi:hypothetical protein T11_6876 [Trichinella zimbabwensis]|uniref:Uncharacterized protein n=1 Tax=Trichinella zimbabwensis TaxID=268475 RepID=A0A0V1I0E5_9BILA|nr:hypothetical protein T11_6876 [Trichinella zimbabwensis]
MNAEKTAYFMRKYEPLLEFLSFEIVVRRRTKDIVSNNINYEYEVATYNLRNEISFTFLENQIILWGSYCELHTQPPYK